MGAGKHLKVSVSVRFALLPPYRSVKRGEGGNIAAAYGFQARIEKKQ